MAYTIRTISLNSYSKIFESFERADAYQSLVGTCFAAVAINRSRTLAWRLWYRRYLREIDRKWGSGNLLVSMLLQLVLSNRLLLWLHDKNFWSFNIFRWRHTMCLHMTGPSHSVNATRSAHNAVSHYESTHVFNSVCASLLVTKLQLRHS